MWDLLQVTCKLRGVHFVIFLMKLVEHVFLLNIFITQVCKHKHSILKLISQVNTFMFNNLAHKLKCTIILPANYS